MVAPPHAPPQPGNPHASALRAWQLRWQSPPPLPHEPSRKVSQTWIALGLAYPGQSWGYVRAEFMCCSHSPPQLLFLIPVLAYILLLLCPCS